MTIHVFGDSFSDEPSDKEPSRWIHLLRENSPLTKKVSQQLPY